MVIMQLPTYTIRYQSYLVILLTQNKNFTNTGLLMEGALIPLHWW